MWLTEPIVACPCHVEWGGEGGGGGVKNCLLGKSPDVSMVFLVLMDINPFNISAEGFQISLKHFSTDLIIQMLVS